MILYLDTSALVKKYVKELGSEEVIAHWIKAEGIVTSVVAYAEAVATLYRKKREGPLADIFFEKMHNSFQNDWKSLMKVNINKNLNEIIGSVLAKYDLRGFDAIHLASAKKIQAHIPKNFVFACYDLRLLEAAKLEGFSTLPA